MKTAQNPCPAPSQPSHRHKPPALHSLRPDAGRRRNEALLFFRRIPLLWPRRAAPALFAALFLAACASTNIDVKPRIALPERFEQVAPAAAPGPAMDLDRWWLAWREPELTRLIEAGLADNRELAATQAKLQEARHIAALADADLGPKIGLSGGLAAQRARLDNPLSASTRGALGRLDPELSAGSRQFSGNLAHLGLAASWEPDIFGAKRSDADAARYQAIGNEEKLYGARLLLAADIADHYFRIRNLECRQAISRQTIVILEELQRYVEGRFAAGHVKRDVVDAAAARLAAAQAQDSVLPAQADAYRRALAVLTGQAAQRFRGPADDGASDDLFARIPAPPDGQAPSDVLARRPDLRAYEAQVRAYAARLASARADLLPRFELRFLGQSGRLELDGSLPPIKGVGGLLGLGVQLPIFTAGRIEANIAASDARLQGALAQYDQALLKALADVDSAYQLQYALHRQSGLADEAAAGERRQSEAARRLFEHGEKTLDEALKARLDARLAEDRAHQARLAEAQNMLNLYKALGGGIGETRRTTDTPQANGSPSP